jgi:hypothetical protein
MRTTLVLTPLLLAVLMAGCAADATITGPPLFLPRHSLSGSGPTALITGTLRIKDACAWIEMDPGSEDLVLWPPGTGVSVSADGTVEITGVRGSNGSLVNGLTVTLGGGEYKDEAFVRELIRSGIPDACRSERYWLATEVAGGEQGAG